MDRNKKCCGAKSGHLGHLFESQMVSERNHVAGGHSSKNRDHLRRVAASWTLEDLTADRGSEDAIITAKDHVTKVIEKEQHHSTSDGWRSATTWNEQETDKCWEEVTSIMTGELVLTSQRLTSRRTMGAWLCTVEPIFLQVVQRGEMVPTGIRMGVKQQTC